jgi:SseB protein N-terminal domain
MNPTTPTNPRPAMSHGGTFIRPGAMGWGSNGQRSLPADAAQGTPPQAPAVIEHALAAAAKDPEQATDLLDELSRARLWLPLPTDRRPVTDGSAVVLPTVTYLGAEFVPAFTSAQRLAEWHHRADSAPAGPAVTPHIVVPAAELARRLPPGVGIALNPEAEASVPIYPEGVGYLAAPVVVSEVRAALGAVPDVLEASRAWLSLPGQGEGLVISVALQDPASEAARKEVIAAIAAAAVGFPVDVVFPGHDEETEVDEWLRAQAEPFYLPVAEA